MNLNLRYPLSPMQLNAIYQWCGNTFDAEDAIKRFLPYSQPLSAPDKAGVTMTDIYLHPPTLYVLTVTNERAALYASLEELNLGHAPTDQLRWGIDHDLRFLSDAEDLDDLTNLWQCFLRYVGMTASADEFPRHLLKPLSRHWVECFCKRWDELVNQPEPRFLNYYHCVECQHYWTDEWSCACDDECPKCGTAYSPYDSAIVHPAGATIRPRVVVRIENGGVSAVRANIPGVIVEVLDEDNAATAPNDEELQARTARLKEEFPSLTKIDWS